MECNPDDLTPDYVEGLRKLPVNRISMGIQTFSDSRLTFLHRRHTASEATEAVRLLQEAGFSNISIDLMFGFPGETVEEWKDDLRKALSLGVQHISAYSLMCMKREPLSTECSKREKLKRDRRRDQPGYMCTECSWTSWKRLIRTL